MDLIPVLDTSAWQTDYRNGKVTPEAQPPDLTKAKALGVRGIFHRIGNGRKFDDSFPLFFEAAKQAGLPIGAYFYFQPNAEGAIASANRVADWVSGYDVDLPVMLDLENYNGPTMHVDVLTRWVLEWLSHVEQRLGRRPVIYSAAWWWNSRIDGVTVDWSAWDTMQARYSRGYETPPSATSEWQDWLAGQREPNTMIGTRPWDGWQFTSSLDAEDFGMPAVRSAAGLDGNLVKADAWARWSGEPVVEPAPMPEPPPQEPVHDPAAGLPPFIPSRSQFSVYPLDPFKARIEQGAQGDLVKYLQGVLNKKTGKQRLKIDGDFGPITRGAVEDVQSYFGVTVDGIVGWDGGDGNAPGRNATWPIIDFLAVWPKQK